MITYAIGDLHGRYDLLSKAISVAEQHRCDRAAQFVVLGDFVDRGPQSAEIIRRLRIEQQSLGAMKIIVIKGNHEDMMVQCARGQARLGWWLGNGGGQTLMSYGYKEGDRLEPFKGSLEGDLEWLDALPLYLETDEQVFVHAGLDPRLPLKLQDPYSMMWTCYDRHKWRHPEADHKDTDFPKHVVHGHEQWEHGPILLRGRTDLDTFAWLTGRLAIGVFDDTQGPPIEVLEVTGPRDPRYDD